MNSVLYNTEIHFENPLFTAAELYYLFTAVPLLCFYDNDCTMKDIEQHTHARLGTYNNKVSGQNILRPTLGIFLGYAPLKISHPGQMIPRPK